MNVHVNVSAIYSAYIQLDMHVHFCRELQLRWLYEADPSVTACAAIYSAYIQLQTWREQGKGRPHHFFGGLFRLVPSSALFLPCIR
jgi:hypothetical protein